MHQVTLRPAESAKAQHAIAFLGCQGCSILIISRGFLACRRVRCQGGDKPKNVQARIIRIVMAEFQDAFSASWMD